jgi:hypothetical protein
MALTQVPPALLTSTTGTGTTVVLSASPTFTGTITTPGVTFSDASSQTAAASPYVLKNRIINGDMRIDQRNAGASVTPSSGVTTYTVDRWATYGSQSSKFTIQQNAGSVTPPSGFTNYLGVTSSSAYSVSASDLFLVMHRIEGFNAADLDWGTANAKTVTLSFWVRSSLTGTFGGSLQNSSQNRNYPFSYTISAANTWEQKTITITGDTTGTWLTTNGIGIRLNFGFGVGSTYSGTAGSWSATEYYSTTGATSVVGTNGATFYITGVQLEVGSTATPFERRLYGQELANCQRYYYRKNAGSASEVIAIVQAFAAGSVYGKLFDLPVTMRANATCSVSAASHFTPQNSTGNSTTAFSAVGGFTNSSTSVVQSGGFSGSSGLTAGNASSIIFNTTSGWIEASAEL